MRNFCALLMFVTMFFLFCSNAIATSWVQLKPEEVVERADVVVIGTFDFSSKPKKGDIILHGYKFNVKSVYEGEPEDPLIVGIDLYDVGWAKEFQEKDGEFLLFLEEAKGIDYLVPVAGPNGMVMISKGKVIEGKEESIKFYEAYLKENDHKLVKSSNKQRPFSLIDSLLFLMGLVSIIYIYLRKK